MGSNAGSDLLAALNLTGLRWQLASLRRHRDRRKLIEGGLSSGSQPRRRLLAGECAFSIRAEQVERRAVLRNAVDARSKSEQIEMMTAPGASYWTATE